MDKIASHEGRVTAVGKGHVDVQIESTSACASCAAHAKCGFAESKNKTVSVPSADWQRYNEGDSVWVDISQGRGMLAVWIAYVAPALLMLAAIIGLSVAGASEGLVAVAALAVLGLYVLLLFLVRRRIEGRFTLAIRPQC